MNQENGIDGLPPLATPAIEAMPHQPGVGIVGKAALATSVAMLSAVDPSSAIFLAGAGAGLQAIGEKLNLITQARRTEFLDGAAQEASLTPEDIIQALLENDHLALLAAEAIDAARKSRLPGKAGLLGRSLGAILVDDSLIDVESLWVRIISSVEPPHIRILGMLVRQNGEHGGGSKLYCADGVLIVSEIGERLGLHEAVLPLVQDLTSNGLVMHPGAEAMNPETGLYSPPDAYGQPLKATPLGGQLFSRLSVAGLEAESN